MDIYIFDIDDTLVLHTKESNDYYNTNGNTTLRDLLSEFKNLKCYIYTNGTLGHGELIIKNLQLQVDTIFARDVIPFMKPDKRSFRYVNREIKKDNDNIKQIVFFDDLKENLKVAKHLGWTTVWINPNRNAKEYYIDYVFPNIYESIIYFKLKKK